MRGLAFDVTSPDAGRYLATIRGEMWWPDSDQLWHRLDTLINRGVLLVLDLRSVETIDSTGIKTLLLAQRTAAQRGATLRLAGPSAQVMRLLTRGGVADLFDIRPDPGGALAERDPMSHDHVTVKDVSAPTASSGSLSTVVVGEKSAKHQTADDTSRPQPRQGNGPDGRA